MSQSTVNFQQTPKKVRHILSLSGGKDSTALAVYMSRNLIYIDNNSSTPCAPAVLDAMLPFFREIYIVIWIEIGAWKETCNSSNH